MTGASSLQPPPVEVASGSDQRPTIDPIALYHRSGEYALRQRLSELDAQQLDDIIDAYAIEEMDLLDLARTYEDALSERIVAAAQQRVESVRTFSPKTDFSITE
jgi:hypothetical protein